MSSHLERTVFYISDGTAITAEVLGHAVLSQFPLTLQQITVPFVETPQKAEAIRQQINSCYQNSGSRPLVFYSIVMPEIKAIIERSEGCCQDILNTLVTPIQNELQIAPTPTLHRTHGLARGNLGKYDSRIAAVEFALAHDDGISLRNMEQADVILLGVSRCGKTPTSLYMAMQFGLKVANYPFIADDMDNLTLPAALKPFHGKLFGLTIHPERLMAIRSERRDNSRYASLRQCRLELTEVELLYQRERIPFIDTTNFSVEEISTKIMDIMQLNRQMF